MLDGIRGIAILLVLWFHFVPPISIPVWLIEWLKKTSTAGWVGVDLFFVLSGFLITGILLDTKTKPNFFRNFYLRRVLRVFPLYYVFLAVAVVLLPVWGLVPADDEGRLGGAAPWLWTFCANIGWFLQAEPRMSWPANFPDLRHFWSLAVEEHFYLIWPFVVWLTDMRLLKKICCLLFGLSMAARFAWVVFVSSDSLIVLQTPFLFDPLAAGAFLAITARDGSWVDGSLRARWLVGLLLIPFVVFFVIMHGLWASHWLMESLGISAISVIFASGIMIGLQAKPTSLGSRIISSFPLRFFGRYSYGLYVTHPVVVGGLGNWASEETWFTATGSETLTVVCIIGLKLSVSLLVAMLSWQLLEKHFLKLKAWFGSPVGDVRPAATQRGATEVSQSSGSWKRALPS
jgi:peptidoglycan/LPS O-acetylase OafA/YrhL